MGISTWTDLAAFFASLLAAAKLFSLMRRYPWDSWSIRTIGAIGIVKKYAAWASKCARGEFPRNDFYSLNILLSIFNLFAYGFMAIMRIETQAQNNVGIVGGTAIAICYLVQFVCCCVFGIVLAAVWNVAVVSFNTTGSAGLPEPSCAIQDDKGEKEGGDSEK